MHEIAYVVRGFLTVRKDSSRVPPVDTPDRSVSRHRIVSLVLPGSGGSR